MKSLKEYSKEQEIMNESFRNLLRGFWNWLIGKKEDEYNPMSNNYDRDAKIQYINNYSEENITIKYIDNSKLLSKIIENSLENNNESDGFIKIYNYINDKDDSAGKINEHNKYIAFVFQSNKLTECCGLIGYKDNSSSLKFRNNFVVYISEFLPMYKDLIDFDAVVSTLKSIDNHMVILDKSLVSSLKKEKYELTKISGKENAWQL